MCEDLSCYSEEVRQKIERIRFLGRLARLLIIGGSLIGGVGSLLLALG